MTTTTRLFFATALLSALTPGCGPFTPDFCPSDYTYDVDRRVCVFNGDAGGPRDAGGPVDAGSPVEDAGADTDAGLVETDAGTPAEDAGAVETDAGAPVEDAGLAETDAGAADPGVDAGVDADAGGAG